MRWLELWVGIFVAAGFAALAMLAFKVANFSTSQFASVYHVSAEFDNIGSLKTQAPVKIAGVTIGRVGGISFDQDSYRAKVVLNIDSRYNKIPADSSASILTAGLLGEQYVGIQPGGAPQYLKNGSEIELTQSALVLEQIISQFLFNKAASGPGGGTPAPSPSPPGPKK